MTIWHVAVIHILRSAGMFSNVQLVGGKVRAFLGETRFLDIHFDPTTGSYSYAVIELSLPYPGDKRIYGWDDFPHPDYESLQSLTTYPHHFQERLANRAWHFSESIFRGNIEADIHEVLRVIQHKETTGE